MTPFEILLVAGLTLLIGAPIWVGSTSKDRTLFWNPLAIFAAVFAYYFLIGPLIAITFGNTYAYGQDFRDSMWKPWLAGLVGLGSIYAGFAFRGFKKLRRKHQGPGVSFDAARRRQVEFFCLILFGLGLVGFAYYAYATGRSLRSILVPVMGDAVEMGSDHQALAVGNYFFLLINTFIPALCMWYVLNADKPAVWRIFAVGLPVLAVVFFYTTLGFRHRIVVLALALSATVYLSKRDRPNPVTWLLGAATLVFFSGLIVLTRSYNHGLDLSLISGQSMFQIFMGGFNDTGTFFTLAMVMDFIPSSVPFFWFQSLWVAATIPVPRALWPGKPEPDYLWIINDYAGTQGQAVPMTGEHYMMAGWPGIVIGGLVVGLIYGAFWNFYRRKPDNPIVVVIYAISFGLCFPLINRGYLAQALMEYFFALMPLVVLYWLFRKGRKPRAVPIVAAVGPGLR